VHVRFRHSERSEESGVNQHRSFGRQASLRMTVVSFRSG
jgi:hypothetical protein